MSLDVPAKINGLCSLAHKLVPNRKVTTIEISVSSLMLNNLFSTITLHVNMF